MTKKQGKKKQINSTLAMNLVIWFLALLMVGYLVIAGILLWKKSVKLEDKLDSIENQKIEVETGDKPENKPENKTENIASTEKQKKNAICFAENCFNIEIADTPEEREKWLMFRESMWTDDAMLFIFETEQKYGFWMKNTRIPLDMIWINANKEVVYIENNVQPCWEDWSITNTCPSYRTDTPALYVLEINAGLAKTLNINVADTCNFTIH